MTALLATRAVTAEQSASATISHRPLSGVPVAHQVKLRRRHALVSAKVRQSDGEKVRACPMDQCSPDGDSRSTCPLHFLGLQKRHVVYVPARLGVNGGCMDCVN